LTLPAVFSYAAKGSGWKEEERGTTELDKEKT
jgi:hypothetical protein